MMNEYKLTIYSAGQNAEDAIESAVRMLNDGATFDDVSPLWVAELGGLTVDTERDPTA